jgi:hypothetical protein
VDTRPALVPSLSGSNKREYEGTEHAVSFRFATTWTSLFAHLEPAKPTAALVPVAPAMLPENHARAPVPVAAEQPKSPAAAAVEEPPAAGPPKSAAAGEVNWEMVIPKMVRPASRTAAPVKEAAPSRPLPAPPSSQSTERKATPAVAIPPPRSKPAATPTYVVTEYQIPTADTEYFPSAVAGPSSWILNLLLGLIAVAALAIVIWIGMRPAATQSVQLASTLGQRGWVRQHAPADAGGRQDRRLILFRPSINSADSEIEFIWNAGGKSIGWALRARDAANYYAMRLKVLGSGQSAALAEERFTVDDGSESPHYDKVLAVSLADPELHVKMSVVGSTFTLYLQGQPQDTWTDAGLATGGLGFLEELNQPVEVQSLRLAYSKIPQSNFAAILQSLRQSFK